MIHEQAYAFRAAQFQVGQHPDFGHGSRLAGKQAFERRFDLIVREQCDPVAGYGHRRHGVQGGARHDDVVCEPLLELPEGGDAFQSAVGRDDMVAGELLLLRRPTVTAQVVPGRIVRPFQ